MELDLSWLRWIGVGLAMCTLTLMWLRRRVWLRRDYPFRIIAVANLLLMLAALYGLVESALHDIEVAPRTVAFVGAIAMTLYAVIETDRSPKPDAKRTDQRE